MAESYSSLLAAMDRLWFHHIILSSEPISGVSARTTALQSCTSSSSESSLWEGDNASTNSSTSSISQDDFNNEVEDKEHDNRVGRKRLSRSDIISNKNRSQSSSPSIQRPRKSMTFSMKEGHKLQRFSSCSILHDLEQEELRGFMDLGFRFEKDQLSPRTLSVIPGLQRLVGHIVTPNANYRTSMLDEIEGESKAKKIEVAKPYLSEAWLVKRPDSPLLRLKMARVSTTKDMKDCLRLWARTVATSMHYDQ